MKILITGAAGFIGSQLAYRLWKEKKELILIDNFSYGKEDNLIFPEHDFRKDIIKMDIRDKENIEKLLKNAEVEYIYNLAGIAPLPDCQSNPQEAVEVNIVGFVNLLENARKYGVKKVIQASTNAIYENEKDFPTKEDNFDTPTLIYPNTKYSAELFAKSFCETYDMNITCVRFANVYGPHIDCLRKQPPFVAYMIRELYYDRTPTFHSDGNQKREGFDCVNCSSLKNYSVNEMYSIVSEIMNKNIKAEYALDKNYWKKYPQLFEGIYKIKDSILKNEINKYTLCDNTYAKNKYNWIPKIDIKEGLKKTVKSVCEMLANLG